MRVLSGETRYRIFDNLSERLAVMIAEDMGFMGLVCLDSAVVTIREIFNGLIWLIELSEIDCPDGEGLLLFKKILDAKSMDKFDAEMKVAEEGFVELISDYCNKRRKMIAVPKEQ